MGCITVVVASVCSFSGKASPAKRRAHEIVKVMRQWQRSWEYGEVDGDPGSSSWWGAEVRAARPLAKFTIVHSNFSLFSDLTINSTSDPISDSFYCHSIEEIVTITLVQKSASNYPYLARNVMVNRDWTSEWTSDWTSD